MLESSAALGSRELAQKTALTADSFLTAWLDVKVMSFDETPPQ
jgi:hypothetical protein